MSRLGPIPRFLVPTLALCFAVSVPLAHTDISVGDAYDMIVSDESLIVVDVREYSEFCGSLLHIEDAANLPWNSGVLQARFAELPTDVDIIVVCASGGRSNLAANYLDDQGFTNVFDMLGGMNAWTEETESCDAEPVLTVSKQAAGVEVNWTPITGTQDYDLIRGLIDGMADAGTHIDLGLTECLPHRSGFSLQPVLLLGETENGFLRKVLFREGTKIRLPQLRVGARTTTPRPLPQGAPTGEDYMGGFWNALAVCEVHGQTEAVSTVLGVPSDQLPGRVSWPAALSAVTR
jgi:rhodanese-related sulfurtransferase